MDHLDQTVSQDATNSREAAHEYFAWSIWSDTRDMVLEVRSLNDAQRKSILENLTEAREYLNVAIKECTK